MDRPRRRPTLQWGHGDGAVEEVNDVMEGDDIPGGFNGATAMEPWKSLILVTGEPMGAELQWGHGDGAVEEPEEHLERKRAARASMGPRRWSRGRVHHAGIPLFKHRCFNGATAMEPWKRDGVLAVGICAGSFNGATAMEPWKSPGPNGCVSRAYLASMGPRRWSRGRAMPLRRSVASTWCFNGATAMEPWKSWRRGPGPKTRHCFNGATAMEPWKSH